MNLKNYTLFWLVSCTYFGILLTVNKSTVKWIMSFNSCTDMEIKKTGDVCKQATMWLFKFAQFVT